jgi:hypothetical protein
MFRVHRYMNYLWFVFLLRVVLAPIPMELDSYVDRHREVQELMLTIELLRDDLFDELSAKDAITRKCHQLEGDYAKLNSLHQEARAANVFLTGSVDEQLTQIRQLNASNAALQQQFDLTSTAYQHTQMYVSNLEALRDKNAADLADDNLVAPPSRISGDASKLTRARKWTGNIDKEQNVRRWKKIALQKLVFFPPDILSRTIRGLHADLQPSSDSDLRAHMQTSYEKSPTTFSDLLPERCLDELVKEGQEEYAKCMQKQWSVSSSLSIKYRSMLSRDKFNSIRHALSYTWDAETGWTRVSFNGVKFPQLQSRYKLEASVQAIKKATGFHNWDKGKGVAVDLRKLVIVNILEAVRTGKFYIDEETAEVRQHGGRQPELMWVLDSAGHHKGMKVTSAGFVFPHGTDKPMSPTNTHEFAQMEAGDNNGDMAGMGKPALKGNTLIYVCVIQYETCCSCPCFCV